MLYLYQSNQLTYLAECLLRVYEINRSPNTPLVTENIIIQSQGMRRFLNHFLSEKLGIAANIQYSLPASFSWQLMQKVLPETPQINPYDPNILCWRLLDLFSSDDFHAPQFDCVREKLQHYLHHNNTAPYHLSKQIADIFDQYLVYRPDWIYTWQKNQYIGSLGEEEIWQATLWRWLYIHTPSEMHRVEQWNALLQEMDASHLPTHLFIFGISTLAPLYLQLIEKISEKIDVYLFVFNPSQEYWGDLLRLKQDTLNDYESDEKATHLANGHPLLSSMGKQGRDFLNYLCEIPSQDLAIYDSEQKTTHSILHQLQDDIQNLKLPEAQNFASDDLSIQINAAHSPLRELQILKDQILQDLAAHPDWQPNDIAILTPNIDAYLPFIPAIFGQDQEGSQHIPYSISDIKIHTQQPLLQVLSSWLAFVQSRCEVEALFDLFDLPLIQKHFQITNTQLDLLKHVVKQQRVCWGLDTAMRQQYGGESNAYTWQRHRQQTTLGWMLPETNTQQTWQNILPWYTDIQHTNTLVQFESILNILFNHYRIWQSAHSVLDWTHQIRLLLHDLVDEQYLADAYGQQLEKQLSNWVEYANQAGFTQKIIPNIALEHIQSLITTKSDAGFLRSGITFCTMVPMRSLPFKCICLLGLNDGEYPRTTQLNVFDLIHHYPRQGDRNRRDDDRYLFLESIMSAQEKLYLSYIGRDIRKNESLAPSVLLNELVNILAIMRGISFDEFSKRYIKQHPLQPFSKRYFQGEFISARQDYADIHNTPKPTSQQFYKPSDAIFPTDITSESTPILLDDFLYFWKNPIRRWLQQTLQWKDYRIYTTVDGQEPFSDSKHSRIIAEHYLDALQQQTSSEYVTHFLQQSNALPDGQWGQLIGSKITQSIQDNLDMNIIQSQPIKTHNTHWDIPDYNLVISGSLDSLFKPGQILKYYRKLYDTDTIEIYLKHLLLCCIDDIAIPYETYAINLTEIRHYPPIKQDTAKQNLAKWVYYYQLGQTTPLPFLTEISLSIAKKKLNKKMVINNNIITQNDYNLFIDTHQEVKMVFGDTPQIIADSPLFWNLINELLIPMLSQED